MEPNNSANFEYNAAYNKQFDLRSTNFDEDGADKFFDIDMQIKQEVMSPMSFDSPPTMRSSESGGYATPAYILDSELGASSALSDEELTPTKRARITPALLSKRRSLSESFALTDKVSDSDSSVGLHQVNNELNIAMENLQMSLKPIKNLVRKSVKFDGLPLLLPREKEHTMVTRLDTVQNTPTMNLRTRSITRSLDVLNNVREEPFYMDRKRKLSPLNAFQPPLKFVSMAEAIHHFQTDTPDRFRSKPKAGSLLTKHGRRTMQHETRPTIPHAPELHAQLRSRPVNHLTREQEEEKKVEEIKNFKLKPLPFNKDVFQVPKLGKRVESRPPTKIEPFKLTDIKIKEVPREETFKFTARPVPKNILEKPTGIGEKKQFKLTDPQTPSFIQRKVATQRRVAPVIDENEVLCTKEIFHFGVPIARIPIATKVRRRSTVAKPFSFEERDKLTIQKKNEKIQKYLEEEKKAREFYANPLPGNLSRKVSDSSMDSENCVAVLPNHKSLLLNDGYAAKREERIRKQREEEEERLKKDTIFKARPATVLKNKPFEVKKVETPLSERSIFELNTQRRAKEREDYDKRLKEKEDELEECKKQRELLKEKEMRKEIAIIRKASVHKAKPAPHAQPLEIQPSRKPLTVPYSPKTLN